MTVLGHRYAASPSIYFLIVAVLPVMHLTKAANGKRSEAVFEATEAIKGRKGDSGHALLHKSCSRLASSFITLVHSLGSSMYLERWAASKMALVMKFELLSPNMASNLASKASNSNYS